MNTNLMQVSQQWATRPNDERFLSLEDLKAKVAQRKSESWTATPVTKDLRVLPVEDGLVVNVYDPSQGDIIPLHPTHWSFGQLAQYAQAPASYLRQLPPELAAINLQYGLEFNPVRDNGLMLAQSYGDHKLRALTSSSYGRIWDMQVVEAVQRVNQDGRWQIPAASYTTQNPRRATTLYASDRDVFVFLVDPQNPVAVGGETLFRGFYTWNSEVGSAVFGLTTFLYRYVCDNRIIWGATDVKELRIRHTGGAPVRFAYEGRKYLQRYANESTQQIVEGIVKAKETDIPVRRGDTVQQWLQERGFTKAEAKAGYEAAVIEEGSARSIWDIVNGITSYAKTIQHTDKRVELEQKASKLMQYADVN
jgi:hypothetical protein